VKGVSSDKNALGYFGLAYYTVNADKLKLVPINDGNEANGKGAISASAETVTNGTYQPLSRPVFIYVNAKAADRGDVKAFVKFYLENAPALAKEIGAVPLPAEVYELGLKHFEAKKTGTVFGKGKKAVGVNMAELLKAEQ
jgi:phosphate transport system substrate-binding protein